MMNAEYEMVLVPLKIMIVMVFAYLGQIVLVSAVARQLQMHALYVMVIILPVPIVMVI